MKNLYKICAFSFFLAAMSLCMISCEEDACYECLGNDTLDDIGLICEGTDGSAEEVQNDIEIYEALGGICVRK